MSRSLVLPMIVALLGCCSIAQAAHDSERDVAEYYARAYAQRYRVPLALVRSVIEQESGWHRCAVSPKGAKGLMQLMPLTAQRLGVFDRCDIQQNISGGVRYLAWLIHLFRDDLRLVMAAYYAGEDVVAKRGLNYRNPDVVAYVAKIRALYRRRLGQVPRSAVLASGAR